MKKRLERELIRLWTGEIAAAVTLWVCYFQFPKLSVGSYLMQSTAYPLLILSFILVQGAFFWWIVYKRLTAVRTFAQKASQVYRVLKVIDIALLCFGVPVVVLANGHCFSTAMGILILLFACIEWVNYYEVRLSYSLNPLVLLRKIANGTLKKSKLAKEIDSR